MDKAREYYQKLVEKTEVSISGFAEKTDGTDDLIKKKETVSLDTLALAKERLKEIEENKPIEYNLKMFLEVSLREENAFVALQKSNLSVSSYRPQPGEEVVVSATPTMPESGCMQVQVDYLWSGHLGSAQPAFNEAEFKATYQDWGTKEINLVVVSPQGFLERNLDFIDVK